MILAEHRQLPREAAGNAQREEIAGKATCVERIREHHDDPHKGDRHRDPRPRRHTLVQQHPARDRREKRRNAHQHERIGDSRARQRSDEEEEGAGEKEPGEEPRASDRQHCPRHPTSVQCDEHAGDEKRHEQGAPEYDLPRIGDRQRSHEQPARRPAGGGDDHERDGAAMAGGGRHQAASIMSTCAMPSSMYGGDTVRNARLA